MVFHHPELVGCLSEFTSNIGTTPELHKIRNPKDAMIACRQAWVDLEQTIGSRKPVDLHTITTKFLEVARAAFDSATVLREIRALEERTLVESRKPSKPKEE